MKCRPPRNFQWRVLNLLEAIYQRQELLMTAQEDIDQAVSQLGIDVQGLTDSGARIETELARLEGQGVDTTGLRDALSSLDSAVGSIASIVPATEPPPVP